MVLAMRFRSMTLAVLVAALSGSTPSFAHDHRPPAALLRHAGLQQEGRLLRQHWSTAVEDGCVSSLVQASPGFPARALPVTGRSFRAIVRLSRQDRPVAISVVALEGDQEGRHLRNRGEYRATLRPRRPGGQVIGWTASFRGRMRGTDLYVKVTGTWDDREGCKGNQRATWAFHLGAA
jgi:hypothetical protein